MLRPLDAAPSMTLTWAENSHILGLGPVNKYLNFLRELQNKPVANNSGGQLIEWILQGLRYIKTYECSVLFSAATSQCSLSELCKTGLWPKQS